MLTLPHFTCPHSTHLYKTQLFEPFPLYMHFQSLNLCKLSVFVSVSRALATRPSCFPPKTHLKTHRNTLFPATFPVTQRPFRVVFARMASGGQKFPPQRQERQPGQEHVMEPTPEFTSSDYSPSNKLRVGFFPVSKSHAHK